MKLDWSRMGEKYRDFDYANDGFPQKVVFFHFTYDVSILKTCMWQYLLLKRRIWSKVVFKLGWVIVFGNNVFKISLFETLIKRISTELKCVFTPCFTKSDKSLMKVEYVQRNSIFPLLISRFSGLKVYTNTHYCAPYVSFKVFSSLRFNL